MTNRPGGRSERPVTTTRFPSLAVPLAALLLVASAVAGGLAGGSLAAQSGRPGSEREMYVSVTDGSGKPVHAVQSSDLVVREDGVIREVLRVSPATEPIDIALVVDNSTVMTDRILDLRRGLRAFVETIGGSHPIALVTIADRPTIARSYTPDRKALLESVDLVFAQPDSGTQLLEAIVEVVRGLEKRGARRSAIVVVTGEGQEFTNLHYEQVLSALERSGAILYAAIVEEAGEEVTDEGGRYRSLVLDLGTGATGGRRAHLLTSMGLTEELGRFAAELDSQYVVVYSRPEALIPPEKIEVSAKDPEWTARGIPVPPRGGR